MDYSISFFQEFLHLQVKISVCRIIITKMLYKKFITWSNFYLIGFYSVKADPKVSQHLKYPHNVHFAFTSTIETTILSPKLDGNFFLITKYGKQNELQHSEPSAFGAEVRDDGFGINSTMIQPVLEIERTGKYTACTKVTWLFTQKRSANFYLSRTSPNRIVHKNCH